MKSKKYLILYTLLLAVCLPLQAKEAKEERSWLVIAQDLYARMLDGVERHDWKYTIHHGRLLARRFETTPYGADANYYIGVSYYQMREYAHANAAFSDYLKVSSSPKFFEEALLYKFDIATKYEAGQRKRMLEKRRLPKLFYASKDDALAIYDEVITAMPRHEAAAIATFRKGSMLARMKEYKPAIETFQTLIRRYPKHPLAPDSYLAIGKVFLDECKKEYPDPELIDRAQLNLEKFKSHFPGEPRLAEAEAIVLKLREEFASELYFLGDFYRRTNKPRAATIYYSNLVTRFPATSYASKARAELKKLKHTFAEVKIKQEKKGQAIIADNSFDELAENDKMVELIDHLAQ